MCFGRGASVPFHFIFLFSLSCGEAQKEKKKNMPKKKKDLTLYDDSRAIIRPIRSSIWRVTMGKSKKVTGVAVWCGMGEVENSPYPRTLALKNPQKHAETRTPLSDRISHVDLQNTADGGWWDISHTHTHTHGDRHARRHTNLYERKMRSSSETSKIHTPKKGGHRRDLDLDLHHTAGDGKSAEMGAAVVVVVVSEPCRAAYHTPRKPGPTHISGHTPPPPHPQALRLLQQECARGPLWLEWEGGEMQTRGKRGDVGRQGARGPGLRLARRGPSARLSGSGNFSFPLHFVLCVCVCCVCVYHRFFLFTIITTLHWAAFTGV